VKCPSSAREIGSSIAYAPHGKNFIEVFFFLSIMMMEKSGKMLARIQSISCWNLQII
jgi:hypothetical protein